MYRTQYIHINSILQWGIDYWIHITSSGMFFFREKSNFLIEVVKVPLSSPWIRLECTRIIPFISVPWNQCTHAQGPMKIIITPFRFLSIDLSLSHNFRTSLTVLNREWGIPCSHEGWPRTHDEINWKLKADPLDGPDDMAGVLWLYLFRISLLGFELTSHVE